MKAQRLGALGLLVLSCRAGGPKEPETAQATIELSVADGVIPEGPLRFAVAWRQGSGDAQRWITTYDVPIGLSGETLTVALDLPPEAERAALSDLAEVRVECGVNSESSYWPVAIPRFVVYQDVDGSGDLNPDLPYSSGRDRIWAVGAIGTVSSEIVAFLDLDHVLSVGGLEMSECIRELTQGLYTPFLIGEGYPSYVEPKTGELSATLALSPTDYPSVAMGCEDSAASSLSGTYGDLVLGSRDATVDTAVAALCASAPLTCTSADLVGSLAPNLTVTSYPGFIAVTRCVVSGTLDVLWHREVKIECQGCSCQRVEKGNLWIADITMPRPNWWPCGISVKYCAGQQGDIWSPPSSCTLVDARP